MQIICETFKTHWLSIKASHNDLNVAHYICCRKVVCTSDALKWFAVDCTSLHPIASSNLLFYCFFLPCYQWTSAANLLFVSLFRKSVSNNEIMFQVECSMYSGYFQIFWLFIFLNPQYLSLPLPQIIESSMYYKHVFCTTPSRIKFKVWPVTMFELALM